MNEASNKRRIEEIWLSMHSEARRKRRKRTEVAAQIAAQKIKDDPNATLQDIVDAYKSNIQLATRSWFIKNAIGIHIAKQIRTALRENPEETLENILKNPYYSGFEFELTEIFKIIQSPREPI